MDGNIVGQLLLQVALIMLNAVFACAEIAVLSGGQPVYYYIISME